MKKEIEVGGLRFKVTDKGGVSVYGVGRFPVILYYDQWMKILDKAPELNGFLEEQLKEKNLMRKEK